MKNLLIMLLSIGLSYTAYANNGDGLNDNIDARNRGYILEQLKDVWGDVIPQASFEKREVLLDQNGETLSSGLSDKISYFTITVNPIVHAPDYEFMDIIENLGDIEGKIPLNTRFIENGEAGFGYNLFHDVLRFETVLKME